MIDTGKTDPKSTRRKSNLVDPETQLSLLKRIAFHWVSFIGANSVALFVWVFLFEAEPGRGMGDIWALFAQRYAPFFLISAAMLPVFLHDTLKLSNKFAGPIQRLRTAMSQLAEGAHVKPMSFRNGDFMQGIATDFNLVLGRVQTPPTGRRASDVTESDESELVAK